MSKSPVALLLVLAFLTASCIAVKPALSSDIVENSWVSKAPMRKARGGLGVAAVNGKIYAIGGSPEDVSWATTDKFLSTNEEYDPATNKWAFKKPMPTPRAAFAVTVYQNKIYCIGGKNSNGYVRVNEVYDPDTDTWETKEPNPTARGFLSANLANGKIYLIGGSPSEIWNLTEVYDPATDSWATGASMPTVSGLASAVFDNKIYKIGSKLQIYDPETDDWSEGMPPPSSVGGVIGAGVTTGVLAPKRIYAIGDSVGVYDPENDTWTVGAKRPAGQKMNFGVVVANDMIYTIGGYNFGNLYLLYGLGFFEPLAVNAQYTPFGYGTVPPVVSVISPENKTFAARNVSLAFTVDKLTAWVGYSLDGQDNVTITGNVTLLGLSSGLHNVTVYAKDEFENIGVSETTYFTVDVPEPEPENLSLPTVVVVALVITIVVVAAGLLVYFKKRKG